MGLGSGGSQELPGACSPVGEPPRGPCAWKKGSDGRAGAPAGNCSDQVTKTWAVCPGFEDDPRNQVVGTSGNDELIGTARREVICGLGGTTSSGLGEVGTWCWVAVATTS